MDSLEELLSELIKYKVVSIIGLAKNVSKTTTLNHLIQNLKKNLKIGLTSIGRDGEPYDIITQLPKPRIFIKEGTYIATAEQSFKSSKIEMELIKATGFDTPLGEILLLKSKENGFIELAGPSINSQLSMICKELRDFGCDLILIDGAFDRKSFATPLISEATIISTGASVDKDMDKVINITEHTVRIFSFENEKDKSIISLAEKIMKESKIGIINENYKVQIIDVPTVLDSYTEIIKHILPETKYLIIKGAITDNLLKILFKRLKKRKKITILAEDATKLFISLEILQKYEKMGGVIKVLYPIKVIALTINPTSPLGYEFNKIEFLNRLKKKIELPIYNLGPCD
jgi:hypothetical protein